MAKNVLSSERRLNLQMWLKKMSHNNFDSIQNIEGIVQKAIEDLNFSIVPSHIRRNAALLNIRLPRSYSKTNGHGATGFTMRKEFTCECGRVYTMSIYKHKRKEV